MAETTETPADDACSRCGSTFEHLHLFEGRPGQFCRDCAVELLNPKTAMPAGEMRALSALLSQRVAEARNEMATNTYWEGATFAQGIDNACGGGAGRLAAMFSPEAAEAVAGWLHRTARQWDHEVRGKLHDACDGAVGEDCVCFAGALATVRALIGGQS